VIRFAFVAGGELKIVVKPHSHNLALTEPPVTQFRLKQTKNLTPKNLTAHKETRS